MSKPRYNPPYRSQSGQLVIEYVLLLIVVVTIALLIRNMLMKRDPDSPGSLVGKWSEIQKVIAEDDPNKR
ncbi:MAG: hypothetical protein BroJett040_07310 [Oligoflexia bacterium]|nr:MAG: hypothetical protein BroJett040_07310 [Oligoflexia bacterium]